MIRGGQDMAGGTLTAEGILKPGTGPAGKETDYSGTAKQQSDSRTHRGEESYETHRINRQLPTGLWRHRPGVARCHTHGGDVRRELRIPPDSRVRGEVTS